MAEVLVDIDLIDQVRIGSVSGLFGFHLITLVSCTTKPYSNRNSNSKLFFHNPIRHVAISFITKFIQTNN